MTDPVCGMNVDAEHAAGSYVYNNQTYYFCSQHCLAKFKEDPEKFLKSQTHAGHEHAHAAAHPHARDHEQSHGPGAAQKSKSDETEHGTYVCAMDPEVREPKPGACPKCGMALEPAAPAVPSVKTEYVCPMHPEIVRDEPGSCPICGMALEPRTVTLDEEVNPELVDMTRRFWICVILTAPIFFLAMSDMIPGQPIQRLLPSKLLNWLQFIFATPVVLWGGWPFFQRGWASIVNRSPNMFTLIAIGVGTAYVYSLAATLFPAAFPESFRGHGGEVGTYFDAAAVITTLACSVRCWSYARAVRPAERSRRCWDSRRRRLV